MNSEPKAWTPAERVFRGWMLISACMYALGCVGFLAIGPYIPVVFNAISRRFLPLPLYPLPADKPEGAFWLVLSASMMAMITWIAVQAYRDPRRNSNLVPILLISKFCSTLSYTVFFIMCGHLAYIVGFVTDGPIFLITAILWYASTGGERHLTEGEERIVAAIGEALMPQGGRFALGYADVRTSCVAGTGRMLASLDPPTLVGLRLALHLLNWASVPSFGHRMTTLALNDRVQVLAHLEMKRSSLLRMLVVMTKVLTLVPFFEQPEAERAVGYDPAARILP